MEKNNMTAVEWLVKEFSNIFGQIDVTPKQQLDIAYAIIIAKQMEKEQIMDAWIGTNTCDSAEQYYNKTYGKNTEKTQP